MKRQADWNSWPKGIDRHRKSSHISMLLPSSKKFLVWDKTSQSKNRMSEGFIIKTKTFLKTILKLYNLSQDVRTVVFSTNLVMNPRSIYWMQHQIKQRMDISSPKCQETLKDLKLKEVKTRQVQLKINQSIRLNYDIEHANLGFTSNFQNQEEDYSLWAKMSEQLSSPQRKLWTQQVSNARYPKRTLSSEEVRTTQVQLTINQVEKIACQSWKT